MEQGTGGRTNTRRLFNRGESVEGKPYAKARLKYSKCGKKGRGIRKQEAAKRNG